MPFFDENSRDNTQSERRIYIDDARSGSHQCNIHMGPISLLCVKSASPPNIRQVSGNLWIITDARPRGNELKIVNIIDEILTSGRRQYRKRIEVCQGDYGFNEVVLLWFPGKAEGRGIIKTSMVPPVFRFLYVPNYPELALYFEDCPVANFFFYRAQPAGLALELFVSQGHVSGVVLQQTVINCRNIL